MIGYFAFLLLSSFILAKLEIQVEGKDGWAKNLPTWRVKNRFSKLIFGDWVVTGYHFWQLALIIIFLHVPFFLGGEWKLSIELKILSLFFLMWVCEDFLWFVLNPNYGLKKFNQESIEWHHNWFAKIPTSYYKFAAIGLALLFLSFLFN